jgi:hypothetical protein
MRFSLKHIILEEVAYLVEVALIAFINKALEGKMEALVDKHYHKIPSFHNFKV